MHSPAASSPNFCRELGAWNFELHILQENSWFVAQAGTTLVTEKATQEAPCSDMQKDKRNGDGRWWSRLKLIIYIYIFFFLLGELWWIYSRSPRVSAPPPTILFLWGIGPWWEKKIPLKNSKGWSHGVWGGASIHLVLSQGFAWWNHKKPCMVSGIPIQVQGGCIGGAAWKSCEKMGLRNCL